jgi:nitrogen-specific signal transduction histidine kinase/ActR/RegA family two-component response regulator
VSGAYEKLSRTQAQLVQSQKMEAVGRLAGGIAHDFNNLLTIVSGRAQILKLKLTDEDPLQRHVELIKKTVERTAGVTRQLLAFSRHQVLNPQTVDLSVLVENMGTMLRALIGEDVELTTALTPGLGAVRVDPGQMEQVVMNLAVNARDAMARGGRLTLATSDLTTAAALTAAAGELPAGAWTVLSVSDTGSGMAPDTLSHIFEPFFTTKPAGQGTGLGLATVYGIVKQSGGHILVDSVAGQGTTFRIALPRVTPTASDAAEVEDGRLPMPGGTETILLVEDEDDVRELEQELLTGLGYRVLTAVNGADAVTVCRQYPDAIDLMISDVIMPVMSGPEAAARALALRPGLKVLFVSGYTDGAIAPHGDFELGVNLLLKPFDPTELARAVRRRLGPEALVTA